jgi:hypothetical protein
MGQAAGLGSTDLKAAPDDGAPKLCATSCLPTLPPARSMISLPKWLEDNPEARFCLLNLDMDIYEPTMVILDNCWDLLVPGGVLILDEYATSKWPGETKAWDDFARRRNLDITLKKFSWSNAPGAYLVKS